VNVIGAATSGFRKGQLFFIPPNEGGNAVVAATLGVSCPQQVLDGQEELVDRPIK